MKYEIIQICGNKDFICNLPPKHKGNCINIKSGYKAIQCQTCDEWNQYKNPLMQIVCYNCGIILKP